jgi:hypothetical protein
LDDLKESLSDDEILSKIENMTLIFIAKYLSKQNTVSNVSVISNNNSSSTALMMQTHFQLATNAQLSRENNSNSSISFQSVMNLNEDTRIVQIELLLNQLNFSFLKTLNIKKYFSSTQEDKININFGKAPHGEHHNQLLDVKKLAENFNRLLKWLSNSTEVNNLFFACMVEYARADCVNNKSNLTKLNEILGSKAGERGGKIVVQVYFNLQRSTLKSLYQERSKPEYDAILNKIHVHITRFFENSLKTDNLHSDSKQISSTPTPDNRKRKFDFINHNVFASNNVLAKEILPTTSDPINNNDDDVFVAQEVIEVQDPPVPLPLPGVVVKAEIVTEFVPIKEEPIERQNKRPRHQ